MNLEPAGAAASVAQGSKVPLLLAVIFQTALCLVSLEAPLFWDTIQFASRHASHYHSGGGFWLPESINSGNPPLLGWMVHGAWMVFGRDLWATHLVTWPFLATNIVLLFRIGRKIAPHRGGWLPLLWLCVPVYAAQTTLVSPDILLVTGILLVIHSRFYYPQNLLLILGGLLLGLVSLRGTALLMALVGWWILDPRHRRFLWTLAPGVILAALYYAFHYRHFGWAMVPAYSPWSASFDSPGHESLPRLAAIWIWRLVDHGMLFLWLAVLAARPWRTSTILLRPETRFLLLMTGLFAFFFLFFDGLNLHRYLLPVFLAALIWWFANGSTSPKHHVWLCLVLLSGNLWTYPEGVARGWDATLAWLPWSWHREHVLEAMKSERIEADETASAFPNLGPFDEIDLSGEQEGFLPADRLQEASYFFYSNIFNDLSDQQIEELRTWTPLASSGVWPVRVTLLKKPNDAIP